VERTGHNADHEEGATHETEGDEKLFEHSVAHHTAVVLGRLRHGRVLTLAVLQQLVVAHLRGVGDLAG
jgi:hypothetical protein